MSSEPKFTMTNDSITVIHENKPYTVQRGTPNYAPLRKALIEEDWAAVPGFLTIAKSVSEWFKGKFTINESGTKVFHEGEELPGNIARRMISIVREGESPEPLFKFWEKLQKNPSYRSVQALFGFLEHEHIPLTTEGDLLAYKSVTDDLKDHHTKTFDNTPGQVLEMPRNKVSDDPQIACHEGFHVGALRYAQGFGSSRRLVICRIDPQDVVSVPYDHSAEKMRVCKYEVIGFHNDHPLPSTTFVDVTLYKNGTYVDLRGRGPDGYDPDQAEPNEVDTEAPADSEAPETTVLNKEVLDEAKPIADIVKYDTFNDVYTCSECDHEIPPECWNEPNIHHGEDCSLYPGNKVEEDETLIIDLNSRRKDGDVEVTEEKPAKKEEQKEDKSWDEKVAAWEKMDRNQLMKEGIMDLRTYAGRHLKLVGASKISGGKTALISKILEIRRKRRK